MRLSSEHDSKYLRLGLFLVFTGFLFALIFVTRVNARELSPQIFDTEAVFVYDNDPLSVYGCDHALYFYQEPLTDEILLSSSFNPEIEQLYDHWYGSRVMDSVRSWGFDYLSYDILKGHIINLMSRTNTFWVSRYDTISNIELKEIVLDDSYNAFYFMDSNFNYYCYVSYIPVNSETVQPEYPFDSFTINDSGHFVEQDPLYRDLFVWDFSNQRWVYSSVSSSDVVVHTVLRSSSGVKLGSGAQVYVESSRFLIDEPLPSSTPTPSPTSAPTEYDTFYFKFSVSDYYGTYYYMVSFDAIDLGVSCSFPLNDSFISYIANQESFNPSEFLGSAFVYRSGLSTSFDTPTYGKPALAFYFTSSGYENFKLYSIPNSTAYEYDPEVIAQTYTYSSVGSSNTDYIRTYDYSYSGVSCFLFSQAIQYNNNYRYNSYVLGSVYGFDYTYQAVNSTSTWYSDSGRYNLASGNQNKLNFAYYGFLGLLGKFEDVENPNGPTPIPTSSPSPTDPPYIVIVTPVPEATPTPPFVIPSSPPFNPPGDGITPLDPELQEDVFSLFKSRLGDNNAFGLFGLLFGLLPVDLMWYIWFLLFLLLVVGVAKLIIHFTGG